MKFSIFNIVYDVYYTLNQDQLDQENLPFIASHIDRIINKLANVMRNKSGKFSDPPGPI